MPSGIASGHLSPDGYTVSPRLVADGERLILRLDVDGEDREAIVEVCDNELQVDCAGETGS